jgi:MFS family permease
MASSPVQFRPQQVPIDVGEVHDLTLPYSSIHPATFIVLAGVSAALHIGKLPPALPALQQALDVSLVQSAFLLSMVQLAGMTLGLAVGLSADSLGLRRCMIFGLVVLSTASALGGFALGFRTLLALRALEGLGFLLAVMPAPALIRRCVKGGQLNARLGWWGTYMPLGSATALLLGPIAIAWMNWQGWWWLLAAVTGIASLTVWRFVPGDNTVIPDAGSIVAAPLWTERLRLTLTSPGPWLVSLSFAVYSSQWIAVVGFLPTVYLQAGLASGLTGALTASVALANVFGNIAAGRLLQRGFSARRLLHIGFVCMAFGSVGAFAQWHGEGLSIPLRFASVLVFSAIGGLIPGTLFSMAVRLAPSDGTVSTTVGYMQQWSALGQFAGPPLVAWIAAWAGGWQWTWVVTAALCALGAVLAHLMAQNLQHK